MDKQQLFENIKRKKSFLCVGPGCTDDGLREVQD